MTVEHARISPYYTEGCVIEQHDFGDRIVFYAWSIDYWDRTKKNGHRSQYGQAIFKVKPKVKQIT